MAGILQAPGDGGALEIFFILIVFFGILLMAYYFTRFMAKRSAGRMKSRYMEVVDIIGIGAESQILLIKAGGEFFLISKTQKQLALLTKLEMKPEDLQEDAAKAPFGLADGFRAVLEGKLGRANAKTRKSSADEKSDSCL